MLFKTPSLGGSVNEAIVGRWRKSEGETVLKDELLVELEIDQWSKELTAPQDGVLSRIVAKTGALVAEGETLAILEAARDPALNHLETGTPSVPPSHSQEGNRSHKPENPDPRRTERNSTSIDARANVASVLDKDFGVQILSLDIGLGDIVTPHQDLLRMKYLRRTEHKFVEITERAPHLGRVTKLFVREGDRVEVGATLAIIEDLSRVLYGDEKYIFVQFHDKIYTSEKTEPKWIQMNSHEVAHAQLADFKKSAEQQISFPEFSVIEYKGYDEDSEFCSIFSKEEIGSIDFEDVIQSEFAKFEINQLKSKQLENGYETENSSDDVSLGWFMFKFLTIVFCSGVFIMAIMVSLFTNGSSPTGSGSCRAQLETCLETSPETRWGVCEQQYYSCRAG